MPTHATWSPARAVVVVLGTRRTSAHGQRQRLLLPHRKPAACVGQRWVQPLILGPPQQQIVELIRALDNLVCHRCLPPDIPVGFIRILVAQPRRACRPALRQVHVPPAVLPRLSQHRPERCEVRALRDGALDALDHVAQIVGDGNGKTAVCHQRRPALARRTPSDWLRMTCRTRSAPVTWLSHRYGASFDTS